MKQENIIQRLIEERDNQYNRPGNEYDLTHTPADWMCLISHYVNQDARRNGVVPDKTNFRDNLIKAGAIIIAALEHIDIMLENKSLTDKDKS